jgi:hypothetical protein
MALGTRGKAILFGVVVVAGLSAWQGFRLWWYHGYSKGERTGYLRKVTIKGSPVCKYVEAELALQSSLPGGPSEVWAFSTDETGEKAPIVQKLHTAARSGQKVTIQYRQDLKSWWRCTPHEYFATDVIQ